MTQTTLSRLLESVFLDGYFTSDKNKNSNEEINNVLERLPFSLSKSQKTAILRALQEDISYIQGPPGTGKSFTISASSPLFRRATRICSINILCLLILFLSITFGLLISIIYVFLWNAYKSETE